MSAKDGRIVLPDGMSYRVLVLPSTDRVTPVLLRKVKELVEGGVTVIGPRPVESPSLVDYPQCDEEVKKLAGELWYRADAETSKSKLQTSASGRVTEAKSLKRVLATLGVAPDFEQITGRNGQLLRWIHRSASGTELYFVANSNAMPVSAECAFRVKGLLPELWHPDTGQIERRAQWREEEGRTLLSLDLDGAGSVFVVFRRSAKGIDRISAFARNGQRDEQHRINFDEQGRFELMTFDLGNYSAQTASNKTLQWNVTNLPSPLELAGPWEVEFNGKKLSRLNTLNRLNAGESEKAHKPIEGNPPSPPLELRTKSRGTTYLAGDGERRPQHAMQTVSFEKLVSWTQRKEPEIKYFSGTATYSKKFTLPANYLRENRRLFLDLGEVQVIASVKLNGQDFGTLWKPPFRVEVTGAIREGQNALDVQVVNLWPNRLIGDEQLPDDCDWKPYDQGGGCGLVKWPDWLRGETSNSKTQTSTARPSGRQTFSTWKYWRKDSQLLESGLIGPARILVAEQLSQKG